jgi:type VI protein secretion system component VasA
LISGENGTPELFQEILHLYNFSDSSVTRKQILGITGIGSRNAVRQIGGRIGAGLLRF